MTQAVPHTPDPIDAALHEAVALLARFAQNKGRSQWGKSLRKLNQRMSEIEAPSTVAAAPETSGLVIPFAQTGAR